MKAANKNRTGYSLRSRGRAGTKKGSNPQPENEIDVIELSSDSDPEMETHPIPAASTTVHSTFGSGRSLRSRSAASGTKEKSLPNYMGFRRSNRNKPKANDNQTQTDKQPVPSTSKGQPLEMGKASYLGSQRSNRVPNGKPVEEISPTEMTKSNMEYEVVFFDQVQVEIDDDIQVIAVIPNDRDKTLQSPDSDSDDSVLEYEVLPKPSSKKADSSKIKGRKRIQSSEDEESSGREKRKQRDFNLRSKSKSKSRSRSRSDQSDDTNHADSEGEENENIGPRGTRNRMKRKLPTVIESDSDNSPPRNGAHKRRKSRSVKKRVLRSATNNKRKSRTEKRRDLMQELSEKVQERKRKLAQQKASPRKIPTTSPPVSDDSVEQSDSSGSSRGSSPCPIVPDDYPERLDYRGPTPSSSSVSSDGEVDEDLDLNTSESDGEADLPPDDSNYMDAEQKSDRTSSSSEEEEPDDGQNDPRCLLCKNLGQKKFKGRAQKNNTDWCKCGGNCRIVAENAGDYDMICCKEIKAVADFMEEEMDDGSCITDHSRFKADVLKNMGYARATSISRHHPTKLRTGGGHAGYFEYFIADPAARKISESIYESKIRQFNYSGPYSKHTQSLRSFKYWIFDCDVENNAMVVPACVQHKVRKAFGEENGSFTPFTAARKCLNGKHCKLVFDETECEPPPPTYQHW